MSPVITGVAYGFVSAVPLLIGAWFAVRREPSARLVGLVAAFGAGALMSAVAFELVLDSVEHGNPVVLGVALALGAVTFYLGSRYLERKSGSGDTSARGMALLLGATLDGVPESFILGVSVAAGGAVSVPFLVAVIVSNLPEGMSSAAELRPAGYSPRRILGMWSVVVLLSAVSAGIGAAVGGMGADTGAVAEAFAAGALLTMVTDDLVPEAVDRTGISAGLAVVVGFAVAFGLHELGA